MKDLIEKWCSGSPLSLEYMTLGHEWLQHVPKNIQALCKMFPPNCVVQASRHIIFEDETLLQGWTGAVAQYMSPFYIAAVNLVEHLNPEVHMAPMYFIPWWDLELIRFWKGIDRDYVEETIDGN